MVRSLFAATALGLLLTARVQAGTLRFPESGPAFVANEPDGWTHEIDANGKRMTLSAPDGDARAKLVVAPDEGVSMDEEAAYMATTTGADPPISHPYKTIAGHLAREYDTSKTDPSQGRIRYHFAVIALESGLFGGVITIIPDSTDPARQAEARAIYDGLMIMEPR